MPAEFAFTRDMGGERRVGWADREIARLAEQQHGVVSRHQLRAIGLSEDMIDGRIGRGIHRVHRAVFAVGHRKLPREGRWMAAVLAGGDGAVLSHRSAAELWDLVRRTDQVPSITASRTRHRRPGAGIVWHTSSVPPDERAEVRGIPVTSVARTLLDLAAVVDRGVLERAVNEAEIRELGDRVGLASLIDRYPGRRGIRALRALLDGGELGRRRTRSELERRFLRFLRRHHLPLPELNAHVSVRDSFVEADCLWRAERLMVELDGRAFHDTKLAFERDRLRDRRLLTDGWRVVRVTWRQLVSDEMQLARDLRALLRRDRVWG